MTVTTKLFLSHTTQAVRLPKDVAFDESVTEVEISVVGEARVITPVGRRLDVFFGTPALVTDDFMISRDQPSMPERVWA
jgi:antitoxin VapB